MSERYETGQLHERRRSTPFEVWIRRSLHARFDMICNEKFPTEIQGQFDLCCAAYPHMEHDRDA
ncbi:hypothetical protein [Komagataeibacter swingsii]|uniref:Uncharacterized protein n=1 Tax=Komagataeibacter swingsii TaxID=215220 RepID=A0A2V4RK43_9PROT|nr:hypothetical protein [Komagataeibacter swingsii]PYD69065.1 hypothetical protein CFR76_11770 [Komagataeibacter swingsii]GBQ66475.1 hypothetical protein AA16373_3245 [Komagataeibacter swingsii DSM 16373]